MHYLVAALIALIAASAGADPLADVRNVLLRFPARQPLHASIELQRSRHSRGRFLNDDFDGAAAFDVEVDAGALRVSYPRALLDRGPADAPHRRALAEAQPLALWSAVDAAAPLRDLLGRAHLVDAGDGRIALKLAPSGKSSAELDGVDVDDDRLTLWIGRDGVPLSARRERHGTAGVLFLHIDSVRTETWTFGVRGDHLVALRLDDRSTVDGPGQRGEARSIWTVTNAEAR